MPSLKTLLLAGLTTLTATTLAAPTTTPNPTTALISKRATYHPSESAENDYCGEANPRATSGDDRPLVDDCTALRAAHEASGYWLVTAAETRAAQDSGAERWTRLDEKGTCAFEVRLSTDNDGEGEPGVVDYRFGTNDLRFYISAHAGKGNAVDGRVGVSSGVWCRRVEGEQVRVDWRVVSS
ncbi:uncharacterized protein B0H64DRAFT_409243 [Chaetomium fimeti]|uniref:Ecp2 effector protein-like domain-containing protein n=1 Tax=Chaetomium fimeti TaxID=1854472 RepID=A0AAE0LN44_9PEZI|nr:hypothetical protein B0H64DRAFT_409243 [Chaetomium fimeti]